MTANLDRKNLYDYFSSQVVEVNERRNLELSLDLMRYLSALLVELSKTEKAFAAANPDTLTEWHFLAGSSRPDKAVHLYKNLGDHALYIAGFFSESLERKPVGVEYYADMGGSAYHRAASLSTLSGAWAMISMQTYPPIDSPASENRSGADANIRVAISEKLSSRRVSPTVIREISLNNRNCGSHNASSQSSPGTSNK